ncbi:hypothetical protein L2E82_45230 [Cichorium intybus]|uniref:Uncharacterized protein n=1 Tax=Cichorium intybus TaxID=13427 RepID=A0ACB8ZSA7_CICIN|nr:hypothetical protein L2E82_45230 [Cichorium intybus]
MRSSTSNDTAITIKKKGIDATSRTKNRCHQWCGCTMAVMLIVALVSNGGHGGWKPLWTDFGKAAILEFEVLSFEKEIGELLSRNKLFAG